MSEEHTLEEIGMELDRVFRTVLTTLGQAAEVRARNSATRDRATAQATKEKAREQRSRFLEDRNTARQSYLPAIRPGALERVSAPDAARAWATAHAWAPHDPTAAAAARQLHADITRVHQESPQDILRRTPDPAGRPGAGAGKQMTLQEAQQLAEQHAPPYYTRHTHDRLYSRGENNEELDSLAAGRLTADWQHWSEHGQLPRRSVLEEWAGHTGHAGEGSALWDEAIRQNGGDDVLTQEQRDQLERQWTDRLEQIWATNGKVPVTDAAALAAEHAPFYYRRHLPEYAKDLPEEAQTANQLRLQQDWQHWSQHGELPELSRMEEWAAYVGRGDEFPAERYSTPDGIDIAQREADLQLVWEQGNDERGAMEFADHLLDLEEAGIDPATISPALPQAADAFDLTGTPNQARGFYAPLLDPAAFNAAEPATAARAWQAAQLWAGAEPAAKAAADQLDRQFQTRYGRSPQAELLSAEHPPAKTADRNAAGIAVAADATPKQPQPAVFRTGDTDLPVTLVGEAQQSAEDGRWYAPTGQGVHVPVDQVVGADPASLGYTPAWAATDGTLDQAEFESALDKVHGASPAAAESAPAATESVAATPGSETNPERARVIELNEMAQEFYAQRLTPDSPARAYLDTRMGAAAVDSGRWDVGHAPAGWTNLTGHLRKAGATDQEIVTAGLGETSSRGNVIDVFRDRAMLGIRDQDGDLVGFVGRDLSDDKRAPKYRNTARTPAFTKGHVLYGSHQAPDGADLVRVEGPFDAIAITETGPADVAGVAPLGTALTAAQADQIAERSDDGTVWLALDRDDAGLAAAAEDHWQLTERGLDPRTLPLPGANDPAELRESDPAALAAALESRADAPSAAHDAAEVMLRERESGLVAGDTETDVAIAAETEQLLATLPETDRAEVDQYTRQRIEEIRERGTAQPATTTRKQTDQTVDVVTDLSAARAERPATPAVLREEPYDRAATANLHGASDAATAARQDSSPLFSRSTRDAVAAAQDGKAARHVKPAKATLGRHAGPEHQLDR